MKTKILGKSVPIKQRAGDLKFDTLYEFLPDNLHDQCIVIRTFCWNDDVIRLQWIASYNKADFGTETSWSYGRDSIMSIRELPPDASVFLQNEKKEETQ